ncbi:TonB-dependent receptor [Winogradskyella arenosi]|uniref:Hemoglobin/transferrin/lactoferrin receptor protein n=1 Tax=Winogradskyella arenosi TaxID=533325 RepID=A0A368ZKH0_9FLAO|nr:TonB-dependent receptor [Winogradskyella arenosi]RCW93405.1 hemoglobin/transferrin/lactoferrin receptor protein [Winogradskyella arenosi]
MALKGRQLIIFSILICFVLSSAEAQIVKVLEAESKTPVAGLALYNTDKTRSVFTDAKGKASLALFKPNELIFIDSFLYQPIQFSKASISKSEAHTVIYLQLKVASLDKIVVSASKFKQNERDIPQTIVSTNAKAIALAHPQTSAEALEQTGHVYVQKSQMGGGSPMIRGFSTNRLLITVDGVRMNNATFRGGNLHNVIAIDPLAVQRTEVTLGAGAVVYGSDAIGGVMSFYTKKPELSVSDSLQFRGQVLTRYASANNENTGHFDVNLGFKNWAFLSSVSYTDFDDLRMGSHGPEAYLRPHRVIQENGTDVMVENPNPQVQSPTAYNQLNVMQKVRYQPHTKWAIDLGLHYSTTSDFSRYDRLLRYREDQLRSAEWNYGPQQWFMGNLQWSQSLSDSNWYDKFKATLAYQNFKESRSDRDFGSSLRYVSEDQVNVGSFNFDLEKRLGTEASLFYGLAYVYNSIGSYAGTQNTTDISSLRAVTRYPNGALWQSVAAYTSLKYKASPKVVFQTGLRYNRVWSRANFAANNEFLNLPFEGATLHTGAFTGTAGLAWSPSAMLQWKLNFSTAFRAPNIDDIGKVFDSEPGAVVVPNPNLKPEYAYSGELGLKLDFNSRVILDLTTYYTFLDQALIRRDYELNGASEIIYNGSLSRVQAMQNASKAWIYGFEAGLEVNFTEQLKLRSQYNVVGGTENQNGVEVPVRHVAPNFGRTHLTWTSDNWLLETFLVYNETLRFEQLAPSEIEKSYMYALDADGNPYAPSWSTLNLRTQYQYDKQLSFTVALENITDQRYRPYSSGITAAGRNLILALNYGF